MKANWFWLLRWMELSRESHLAGYSNWYRRQKKSLSYRLSACIAIRMQPSLKEPSTAAKLNSLVASNRTSQPAENALRKRRQFPNRHQKRPSVHRVNHPNLWAIHRQKRLQSEHIYLIVFFISYFDIQIKLLINIRCFTRAVLVPGCFCMVVPLGCWLAWTAGSSIMQSWRGLKQRHSTSFFAMDLSLLAFQFSSWHPRISS